MRSPALRLRASFAKLRSERFCWPLSIEAKSTTLLLTTDFVAASGVLPNVHSEGRALLLRASLSTVLLARISIPISRCNLYAVQACGFDCSRH